MSHHEKKTRPLRTPTSTVPTKSPIATPPRAALQGRSKTDHVVDDSASTKSGVDGNASSETEDSSHPSHATSNSASTSTPPLSSQGRDAKIAELERELATMADEFERELTQLSHKLTNENEAAQFWQAKHSSLNQNFLKTDTDLRLLRQEIGVFQSAREERDRDIKTRISSLMLDRDAFREAYNEAMGDLRGKEEEVRKLQGQVRGLKSFVSTSSKMDEQVTDEAFGESMQRLGNGLQNWVITNFRRVKIDTSQVPTHMKEPLLNLVPTYESLASSSKIHLIQSLVSRLLVEHIFQAYFVGLSKTHAEELERIEEYLSTFGTADSLNQWRSTTLSIIHKDSSQKFQSSTSTITESLIKTINRFISSFSDIQASDSRDQSLHGLVNSSIELSRLLRVQKAVFQVSMPSIEGYQRTMFDPDTMEDIGGEDEDMLSEREIRCVTFPGIVKSGDENGERMHLRNVVAKIRVLCAPG